MNTIMLYIENISSKKNAYDVQWNNKSERKKRHYGYDIGTGFVKKKKTLEARAL